MARRRKEKTSDDLLMLVLLIIVLLAIKGASQSVLNVLGIALGAVLFLALLGWGIFHVVEKVQHRRRVASTAAVPVASVPVSYDVSYYKPLPPRNNLPVEIEVECPNCRNELVAPIEMAGDKARCEVCQAVFQLPKVHASPGSQLTDATHAALVESRTELHSRFSIQLLKELEWKRFERLVEAYFEKTGWRTQLNRTGPDGGVDVCLFRPGQEGVSAVVQCKAWNTYKVGIKPVRELLGVMAAGKIPEGYFVTTDVFTQEALDFAHNQPLTLLDGFGLLRRINALSESDQRELLDLATAGDYITPTCPSCGRKMVVRVSGKGRNIGSSFWGCPSYPRCKAHLNMKKE